MAVNPASDTLTLPAEHAAVATAAAAADRNPFVSAQYRWWWGMTFCMSLAVGVQLVTVPTYVLDRTNTRFYVALAVLCQTIPTALLTLLGGAVADRIGSRRILRTTLAIGTSASSLYLVLSVGGARQLWPVFLIAAVVGSASAFQTPTRQSLINKLAPGNRLQNGVIWGTMGFMGGQSFIGPAVGGLVVGTFGLTPGFAIEVALLVCASICVLNLKVPGGVTAIRGTMLSQIGAGLRYVRGDARLWQVLILGSVPGLFFMGVGQATFPILARDTFHRGASGIGVLNMGMGVGILTGSALLAVRGPRHGRGAWILRALPIGGTAYVLAGLAPSLLLAALGLLVMGLGAACFINFASTLMQTYAAPAYMGRVMSIYSLCFMAAVPLGNLQAGIGLQLWSARAVMVYSGAAAAALGVAGFALLRAVRSLD